MQKIFPINLHVLRPIFNIYVKGPHFYMSVAAQRRPINSHCPRDRANRQTTSIEHSTNHVITFVTYAV